MALQHQAALLPYDDQVIQIFCLMDTLTSRKSSVETCFRLLVVGVGWLV